MARTPPPKRHVVTIKRPSSSLGTRGQKDDANATTVAEDIPCSIEPLAGRELELARSIVADATQRVRFYDDPDWNLTPKDWLVFGTRRLNIGHIMREEEIEQEAILLCGEEA